MRSPAPRWLRAPAVRAGLALATALALGAGIGIPAAAVVPDQAAPTAVQTAKPPTFPTWDEVQKAKGSVAATQAAIARARALVDGLKADVKTAQAKADAAQSAADTANKAAEAAGQAMATAQDDFVAASQKADTLAAQASDLQNQADKAMAQAGALAAQLYRTGGNDLTTNLLLGGAQSTDNLLAGLGSMSMLVQQQSGIYEQAQTSENLAQAAVDQANVAKQVRADLKQKADAAFATAQDLAKKAAAAFSAAQSAQNQAESVLADANSHIDELNAQIAYLNNQYAKTYRSYQAGVAYRAKQAEIARQKKLAAERAAALQQQQAAGTADIAPTGWALPVSGWISSPFGPRVRPCGICNAFHLGVDLATGTGTIIRAAHDGTVVYAGWNGTYGYFILIDHGSGVYTGYAHMEYGGILVSIGQQVAAGQPIGRVGMTGDATGPHLHFEVRLNGVQINPYPFMLARGIRLGG